MCIQGITIYFYNFCTCVCELIQKFLAVPVDNFFFFVFLQVEGSGVLAHWAGDSFLFRLSPLSRRLFVVGIISTVFLFPLALLRSLSALKFTSTLSLLCIT